MANKIFLGSVHRTTPEVAEAQASEAITAGHLVLLASGKFKKHDVAGGGGFVYVANSPILEDADYAYAADETAFCYKPGSKELYQMRVGASQTIVKDDALASAGDGTLAKANGTTDMVIAYADEAVTTGVGEAATIRVKFV